MRCHPHIQPVDVLYFSKMHSVAIETVFKDYMTKMGIQAQVSIRYSSYKDIFYLQTVTVDSLNLLVQNLIVFLLRQTLMVYL